MKRIKVLLSEELKTSGIVEILETMTWSPRKKKKRKKKKTG